ncbi:DUF4214 domain-containing protein [Bisbaumannia pacifica]|uniref:DUF4214 domain-containing protein n=1 Tax=Bisbaumannia pacifica TaxID=77098 RepID=A0ABD4KZI5_9GAMM|nr:DUF4214 domain-containing protein [Halomonas pacifica]MBH8578797.1 DUF4214 domain-containing protein [Halomonas pacifica]
MSLKAVNKLYDEIYQGRAVDRSAAQWYADSIQSGDMSLGQVRGKLQDVYNTRFGSTGGGGGGRTSSGSSSNQSSQSSSTPSQGGFVYDGPGTVEDYLSGLSKDKGNGAYVSSGPSSGSGILGSQMAPKSTADHLSEILSSSSPLMQRAESQGQQLANQRGLLNSSMASGAAMGAMIDRALPVAQQDAQYQQQRGLNAQGHGFDMERMQQDYQNQLGLNEQGFGFDMDRLQASSTANAWGVMANNITDIVAQAMDSINRIQQNPNIAAADKESMIQQIIEMRDTDIEFQGGLYESLSGYLKDTGLFPALQDDSPQGGSQAQVRSLYRNILGRDADQAGLAWYLERLNNGQMTLQDIEQSLRNSAEYAG